MSRSSYGWETRSPWSIIKALSSWNFERAINYEFVPSSIPPHRDLLSQSKIMKIYGMWIVPYPANSADLAPPDYVLFMLMSSFLWRQQFNMLEEFEKCCVAFFASKSTESYCGQIRMLAERWANVVEIWRLTFPDFSLIYVCINQTLVTELSQQCFEVIELLALLDVWWS